MSVSYFGHLLHHLCEALFRNNPMFIDPVQRRHTNRKLAILPFPMVTCAIQSYIKTKIFIQPQLSSFDEFSKLTVVLETQTSNLLVKSISD